MSDYNRGFGSRSAFPPPLNLSGMPPELAAATIEAEEGQRAWRESTRPEPIAQTQASSPDSSYEPYKSPSLPEGVNTVDPYYGIRRAGDTQQFNIREAGQRAQHQIGSAGRRQGFNIREAGQRAQHQIGSAGRRQGFNIREAGQRAQHQIGSAGRRQGFNIREAGAASQHQIGKGGRRQTFNIRQQERESHHRLTQSARNAQFNIREAERRGLRGVTSWSHAESRAARWNAHNLSNELHAVRTQLSREEINTETSRALRNAALNAFDPYAEGRYSRAQNRIRAAADNARQLSSMQFKAAREHQKDVTGFAKTQAKQRAALSAQQYANKQKQLTAEARIAQTRERHQQDNLLRTFKSSVKASIEGVRENMHKESLALRNRAKRGNLYSAAEKAASASRSAAAAALQHGSTTMQRTAMNTKLLAETTLASKHTLLSKQLDSYNTLGITFSRQLSAVQRATSLSGVRNAQAAYTEALKADLDALYEVTV